MHPQKNTTTNMEDRTYKKVGAIVIVAAIFGVATYGSYLPMRKAQMFIATLQSFQDPATAPTSLQDVENRIAGPLDYVAPIGQEELVRNTANSVLAFIQNGLDATSTAQLVGFLNNYYDPILNTGKGMSFGQDVYLEGAVNEIAFGATGNATYLAAAQHWFSVAVQLGPDRPQALYGLFDVYRAAGDTTDTVAVAQKILSNWPTDTRIQQSLQQYETTQSTLRK